MKKEEFSCKPFQIPEQTLRSEDNIKIPGSKLENSLLYKK